MSILNRLPWLQRRIWSTTQYSSLIIEWKDDSQQSWHFCSNFVNRKGESLWVKYYHIVFCAAAFQKLIRSTADFWMFYKMDMMCWGTANTRMITSQTNIMLMWWTCFWTSVLVDPGFNNRAAAVQMTVSWVWYYIIQFHIFPIYRFQLPSTYKPSHILARDKFNKPNYWIQLPQYWNTT